MLGRVAQEAHRVPADEGRPGGARRRGRLASDAQPAGEEEQRDDADEDREQARCDQLPDSDDDVVDEIHAEPLHVCHRTMATTI